MLVRTLAGRYTLEDRVLEGSGWSYWRGEDAILHRAVGVLVLAAGDPRELELAEAARRSSATDDHRIQRVLDVLDDSADTCLVVEWLAGSTGLEEALAEGPLVDAESRRLTLELARTLATAARDGLEHGALAPRWVIRSEQGRVRLLGVAIAPVLTGRRTADAYGLGELLYACLTARWPGSPDDSALPAAPQQGGRPVRARMIRAGVPAALDDVAARALGLPGRGAPLLSAADVVAALEAVPAWSPALTDPSAVEPGLVDPPGPPRRGGGRRAVAVGAVVALVLAAAVMTGLSLVGPGPGVAKPGANGSAASASRSGSGAGPAPGQAALPVLSVHDFDPRPKGNGTENPSLVPLAFDGNPGTAWTTLFYTRPDCGGLKPGVGLVVDLGLTTQVGAVRLGLVGHGTSVEILASTSLPTQADDAIAVARADNAGEFVTLPLDPPVRARYLVIWLTRLPADIGGYRGGVSEIQVFHS